MSAIISIENLSKKFIISHEQKERYTALRDVMAKKAKRLLKFDRKKSSSYVSEEFWALKDVSFDVNPGDRVGIVGRNGAGKSTLLKILSRITEPTNGRITIRGRVASLLEVGTGFHPELTGRENIFLNGAILGMSRAEIRQKFDEIVAFAEVENFLDTPVKRYSSGMHVRLAFAVAAHLEPEILIVDEVLAVGDAQFQKKCLGKMEDVSKMQGRTVLFVSHQMPTILNLCNKCVFLEKGKIKEIGSTSEVVANYMQLGNPLSFEFDFVSNPTLAKKAAPYFTLERVYLEAPNGNNATVLQAENNDLIQLVIEGSVEEEDVRFNLGFALTNEFGEIILMSFSTDQPETNWLKLNPGSHIIRTVIDTSVLNEGKYYISLLASLHCVRMLYDPNDNITLGFEIVGNRGRSPYWIDRRSSILAPFIKWSSANTDLVIK